MDFLEFKTEWSNAMVYIHTEMDYEEVMHELYVEYKQAADGYGRGMTVKEWCEFYHNDCDLDEHPYMLKEKYDAKYKGETISNIIFGNQN